MARSLKITSFPPSAAATLPSWLLEGLIGLEVPVDEIATAIHSGTRDNLGEYFVSGSAVFEALGLKNHDVYRRLQQTHPSLINDRNLLFNFGSNHCSVLESN